MFALLIPLLFGVFLQPTGFDFEASVNQVIDGMTIDAQIDGVRTPIGYLGAETPALPQRCGREAMERNRELAGTSVLLVADQAYDVDQLHRRLFYAYTADGISIDEALISEGLAHAVRTDAAHGVDLASLEADAQASAQGCLWSSQ